MFTRTTALAGATALLLLAACASEQSTSSSPAAVDVRTVEVLATDALSFEPSDIQANAGETVKFVVSNQGATEHEFTVGDDSTSGMISGPMMGGMEGMDHGDGLASVSLPGNGTAELIVTFEEPGIVPFACHVNGHDEAGMVGTITVS